MMWKIMSKIPGAEPSLGQGPRHWPFFALLLAVVLLGSSSWFYTRSMPGYIDQISGDNLNLTPSHFIYNPFGPNHTFEKAGKISDCVTRGSRKSSSRKSNKPTSSTKECPSYFQWIQRDLAPWKETGITQATIDLARTKHVAFKAVIVDSKLYIDHYSPCFGNRALFSVWGILLLLEKYKGQVPDVELIFSCGDQPRVPKSDQPTPLFSYCSNDDHHDIPFPDWSFWGWSELMIDPWDQQREKILKGSKKVDWSRKAPTAYWSGNPYVGSPNRRELLRCNGANKTEIHIQDWRKELPQGKKNSKLENQCTHRYMIYIEGIGWSVSLKYIIACGSPVLAISPSFYDFFSRGLEPWVHFIPVRPSQVCAPELCEALDKQVEFGETNATMAIQIGKSGQHRMKEEVDMQHVYDYMFHLLREYSSLLKFRPTIPEYPHLVTLDHLLCIADSDAKSTLQQAMKVMPLGATPCHLSDTSGDRLKESKWLATGQRPCN